MDFSWERDGVLFGKMTHEEKRAGGRWAVGDLLPSNHPGCSPIVRYKSWVASKDKYAPGMYPFKDRGNEKRHEYVNVAFGSLTAVIQDANCMTDRYTLSVGEALSIGPSERRSWELPERYKMALGSTLLWSGHGFCNNVSLADVAESIYFWQWINPIPPIHFTNQFFPGGKGVQYWEVFQGSAICHIGTETQTLSRGEHVYARTGLDMWLEPLVPKTRGIILRYMQ